MWCFKIKTVWQNVYFRYLGKFVKDPWDSLAVRMKYVYRLSWRGDVVWIGTSASAHLQRLNAWMNSGERTAGNYKDCKSCFVVFSTQPSTLMLWESWDRRAGSCHVQYGKCLFGFGIILPVMPCSMKSVWMGFSNLYQAWLKCLFFCNFFCNFCFWTPEWMLFAINIYSFDTNVNVCIFVCDSTFKCKKAQALFSLRRTF